LRLSVLFLPKSGERRKFLGGGVSAGGVPYAGEWGWRSPWVMFHARDSE